MRFLLLLLSPFIPYETDVPISCTRHKYKLTGELRLNDLPMVQQHAVQQYMYTRILILSLTPHHLFKSASAFRISERQVEVVRGW